jgi:hypothetical protein
VAVISSIYSIIHLNQESGEFVTGASDLDDPEALPDREEIARANADWRRKLWDRLPVKPLGPGDTP